MGIIELEQWINTKSKKLIQPTCSISVLLYGDYPEYAERCLNSILSLPCQNEIDIRIGINEIGPRTRDYVKKLYKERQDWAIYLYRAPENIGKYPMLRHIINDEIVPVAPLFMHFDDDSYIKTPTAEWYEGVKQAMCWGCMCGQLMTTRYNKNQLQWIRMQPWYNGKEFKKDTKPHESKDSYGSLFAVGGWWTIETEVLKKLDWPPVNIIHRGGDYMLGEALRQNNFKLVNYRQGVVINADETDTDNSAKRRGLNPRPCGLDYQAPLTVVLHDSTRAVPINLLD